VAVRHNRRHDPGGAAARLLAPAAGIVSHAFDRLRQQGTLHFCVSFFARLGEK
jgi:hypothetical protein